MSYNARLPVVYRITASFPIKSSHVFCGQPLKSLEPNGANRIPFRFRKDFLIWVVRGFQLLCVGEVDLI